jgi:hypothetical protein
MVDMVRSTAGLAYASCCIPAHAVLSTSKKERLQASVCLVPQVMVWAITIPSFLSTIAMAVAKAMPYSVAQLRASLAVCSLLILYQALHSAVTQCNHTTVVIVLAAQRLTYRQPCGPLAMRLFVKVGILYQSLYSAVIVHIRSPS